jgi:hypothetical protein
MDNLWCTNDVDYMEKVLSDLGIVGEWNKPYNSAALQELVVEMKAEVPEATGRHGGPITVMGLVRISSSSVHKH